jgi:DNA (cytosine-5)-methyltransferase 1
VPPTNDSAFSLLPTPNPFHLKNTESPEEWAARRAEVKTRTRTNLGMPLPVAVQLLPTPTVQDGENNAGPSQHRRHSLPLNTAVTYLGHVDELDPPGEQLAIPMPGDNSVDWGPYGPAVARWERVLGRPAPEPVTDGVLSARFTEWVMGLPEGWVTSVPGIARGPMLRMMGNGVVPAQAAAALVHLGIRDRFP